MSAEAAARVLKSLRMADFRTLLAIELGMGSYEYVPVETIAKFAGIPMAEVGFHLARLHDMDLIGRWSGAYVGYYLRTTGYDCLALNALVKSDVLQALGKPLGIGKEADIYDALTPDGERVAVKFHRLGRTSFRHTRRKREFVGARPHISWLYQSRLSAEMEYKALKRLHGHGVSVPRPIAHNRHAVVMELIVGAELVWYKEDEVADPEGVLREILANVREAYRAGIIHADLSEYNVVMMPDGHILLIDWPQYVSPRHPNADLLLERDVRNLLKYFRRKFRVKADPEEALAFVKAKTA